MKISVFTIFFFFWLVIYRNRYIICFEVNTTSNDGQSFKKNNRKFVFFIDCDNCLLANINEHGQLNKCYLTSKDETNIFIDYQSSFSCFYIFIFISSRSSLLVWWHSSLMIIIHFDMSAKHTKAHFGCSFLSFFVKGR